MGSCLCLPHTHLNKINSINDPNKPSVDKHKAAPLLNLRVHTARVALSVPTDKLANQAPRDASEANYVSVDELSIHSKKYAPRTNSNVPTVKPGIPGARDASRANDNIPVYNPGISVNSYAPKANNHVLMNKTRNQATGDALKANSNVPEDAGNRDASRANNNFPLDNSEIHANRCAPRDNTNIPVVASRIRANGDSPSGNNNVRQHKTGIWYIGDAPRSPVNRFAPTGNRASHRGSYYNNIRVHNARIQADARRNNLQKNVLILLGMSILYIVHITRAFKNEPSYKYDIFLSFRGSDTRKAFLSHLESGLRNQGIKVFVDRKLEKGKAITLGLEESIRKSKIGIIVFSKDFAASSYCLDETTVLIASHGLKHRVIPIFHGVNPSDVVFQNGTFADAFEIHEETYKCKLYIVQNWRWALTKAANLAGWVSDDFLNESDMIDQIVDDVKRKLRQIRGNGEPFDFDSIIKFWRLCVLIYKTLSCAYERFYEEAILL